MLFFTINIAERNRSLLIDHADHLRDCMKKAQQLLFFIDAIVTWRDMILSNMIVGLRASAPTYGLERK